MIEDQREVSSLSRQILESVSIRLPDGIGLLSPPLPASLSSSLAAFLPLREQYGLTLFRSDDTCGLGPLYYTGSVVCPRRKRMELPYPLHPKPVSILRLLLSCRCSLRVRMCWPYHSPLPLSAAMLADLSSSHDLLSNPVDCSYVVRGLLDGSLPNRRPPRVLPMGRQVRSRDRAGQSSKRLAGRTHS